MKIKRFFAEDIRQAMKMVKEELGSDAVIMSNKSVDGGVEIVAARDFDEQQVHSRLETERTASSRPAAKKTPHLFDFDAEKSNLHVLGNKRKKGADGSIPPLRSGRQNTDKYVGYAEKAMLSSANIRSQHHQQATSHDRHITGARMEPVKPVSRLSESQAAALVEQQVDNTSDRMLLSMREELKALRSAMDSKFSEFNWTNNIQSNPTRLDLLQRLAGMGISKKLSIKITNRLGSHKDMNLAFEKAQDMLANALPIEGDSLLEYGGVAALVGPTGVGKTTTIAKLAAKFILKHGPRQVALITTDNYRIAAHEQLNIYGRILDVPVRVAANAEELRNLINNFSDKRLILIDTAGMSQRDQRVSEQIECLQQSDIHIKPYLVMSAATEIKAMNEIIKTFNAYDPEACILTKLDESVSKGPALSALIENRMSLSYITDGQEVPENLHLAEAKKLVAQCVAELDDQGDNGENSYNNVSYEDWVAQGYA